MGVVALQREVLEAERGEVLHLRVEPHARKRPRRALELLARLLEVVQIEVRVAQRQDELAALPALRRSPMAPLVAVHRAELAVLVGPLVPDRHAALLQPAHIGFAAQEPQQLVDDRLQVQLLGGEQREAVLEREAHLAAEHRERAGPGAVRLAGAALEQLLQQVEILLLAGVHIAMLVKSSRALWNRSSGFFASRRSMIGW